MFDVLKLYKNKQIGKKMEGENNLALSNEKKTVTLDLKLFKINLQEMSSHHCLTHKQTKLSGCECFLDVLVFVILYNTIQDPESPFIVID